MDTTTPILILEDVASDAALAIHRVRAAGIPCAWRRVETEGEFRSAPTEFEPQVIPADFSLLLFGGTEGLTMASVGALRVPFICLMGTLNEAQAVETLRLGAVDSVSLLRSIADRLRERVGAIGGCRLDVDVTEQAVLNDADRARTELAGEVT
jgi:DNA-binding NtrC family response regulator